MQQLKVEQNQEQEIRSGGKGAASPSQLTKHFRHSRRLTPFMSSQRIMRASTIL